MRATMSAFAPLATAVLLLAGCSATQGEQNPAPERGRDPAAGLEALKDLAGDWYQLDENGIRNTWTTSAGGLTTQVVAFELVRK